CENDHQGLDRLFDSELKTAELDECLKQLDAAPEHYVTPTAMDDLDDVRRALGYGAINLWGGSYGTRAALVFARRHPEATRRIILDGPAPLSLKLPLYSGRDAQRALERLSSDCESQPRCGARFGNTARVV